MGLKKQGKLINPSNKLKQLFNEKVLLAPNGN